MFRDVGGVNGQGMSGCCVAGVGHTHTFHCPLGLKDAGIFCLCTGPKINSTGSSHQNKTTLGSSGKRQGTNSVYWEKRKLCNRLPGMLDILEAFTIWQLVYIRF